MAEWPIAPVLKTGSRASGTGVPRPDVSGRGLAPATGAGNPSLQKTNMAFVYVIYSSSRQRTYVGCSDDWQTRLETHNAGRVTTTRSGIPWRLVHLEEADSFLMARRREAYLKSSAGRRWLAKTLGKLEETGRPDGTMFSPLGIIAANALESSAMPVERWRSGLSRRS